MIIYIDVKELKLWVIILMIYITLPKCHLTLRNTSYAHKLSPPTPSHCHISSDNALFSNYRRNAHQSSLVTLMAVSSIQNIPWLVERYNKFGLWWVNQAYDFEFVLRACLRMDVKGVTQIIEEDSRWTDPIIMSHCSCLSNFNDFSEPIS